MNVSVIIKRYDPVKADASYKEEHRLYLEEDARITILDVLRKIRDDKDGSLAFRCSCSSGICGSCAVRVNGHEALACTTGLMDSLNKEGKVIIEPLKNLTAIKDLVVDLTPMWDRLKKSDPWLIPDHNPPQPPSLTPPSPSLPKRGIRGGVGDKGELEVKGVMGGFSDEKAALLDMASGCILCGACYSDCEAFKVDPDFLGPAVFNKAYRFVIDPRDSGGKDRLKKLAESGLWHCAHCYLCASICPKGIIPKDSISYLRAKSYRMGLKDDPGASYVDGFYHGIKRTGRISEPLLAFKVKGIGILKEIPFFLKLLTHGKVPRIRGPIKGIKEIRKLYKIIEDGRRGKA
ncbi:MAG: succinate dehydrogenase/fumarate reductase iron-sulfur subunit [Nitrospirota bacterium]